MQLDSNMQPKDYFWCLKQDLVPSTSISQRQVWIQNGFILLNHEGEV